MHIYQSSEDYLERILMLKNKNGIVRSIDIANDMGFSKASISRAVKNLKTEGYILVDQNGSISLTSQGLVLAQKVYDKHQLLTNFFQKIGVSPEIASLDACKVEHDISEETMTAIQSLMKKL